MRQKHVFGQLLIIGGILVLLLGLIPGIEGPAQAQEPPPHPTLAPTSEGTPTPPIAPTPTQPGQPTPPPVEPTPTQPGQPTPPPVEPTPTQQAPRPPRDDDDDDDDDDEPATGRITGAVIDLTTGAPAPGIAVTVGDQMVTTDSNGNYDRSGLPGGAYTSARADHGRVGHSGDSRTTSGVL
jgi:hypothetical protein